MNATFTRELRCRLSPEERLQKANNWTGALNERDALEAELAEIKDSFKTRMKRIDETIEKLRRDVETATELRVVTCAQEPDFGRNTVTVRRLDTLEVIEERAMEVGERQAELNLDSLESGASAPPAAPAAPATWWLTWETDGVLSQTSMPHWFNDDDDGGTRRVSAAVVAPNATQAKALVIEQYGDTGSGFEWLSHGPIPDDAEVFTAIYPRGEGMVWPWPPPADDEPEQQGDGTVKTTSKQVKRKRAKRAAKAKSKQAEAT